jgi:hypothetical protein
MRIRKYDFNYSRRAFLDKMATGAMAAGVLSPLWPLIARAGDITKAGVAVQAEVRRFEGPAGRRGRGPVGLRDVRMVSITRLED